MGDPSVSPRGDMIDSASIFYSERPGHEGRISEVKRKKSNIQYLTLRSVLMGDWCSRD